MLRQQECSRSAVRRQPERTGGRKPKGRRRPRQRSFLRMADARKPRSKGDLKPPDWRSPAGSAQPRRAADIPESASFPAGRTIHPAVSASAIAKPHSPSSLITEKSPSPARQQQMTGAAGKTSDRNERQRQKAKRIARTRVHQPARTAGGRYLHRQPEEEGAPAMAQPAGAIAPASALSARSGVARIAASPTAKGCANMPPASRRKTIARQVPANPKRNPSGATPKISPVKTGSP